MTARLNFECASCGTLYKPVFSKYSDVDALPEWKCPVCLNTIRHERSEVVQIFATVGKHRINSRFKRVNYDNTVHNSMEEEL